VRRSWGRLTIGTRAGRVSFADGLRPATSQADGDNEIRVCAGRFGAARHHRVEWRSEHDSPGAYLVDPANAGIAFVHNGEDVVRPSADGRWRLGLEP
jgi:hypothetical protein